MFYPLKFERKQKERREREMREERQPGGHSNFLEGTENKRRDKKQGDGETQQGAKKMEFFFIYHLSLPCLSLVPLELKKSSFSQTGDLSPLQEAPLPLFCLLSETTRKQHIEREKRE